MNKILITGGAGFIGSNLAEKLCKENKIVIVDDLSMGKKENIEHLPNVTFFEENVLNFEFMSNLLLNENFNYIFHLAAIASVADSIERPLETNQVNFMSTLNMLDKLRTLQTSNLKRFVFASSAAVYGDSHILPKTEETLVQPLTPYAIDKFASERYVLTYNRLYNIPTSCVRFFNVYGPNQNPSSQYSGVISILMDRFEKKMMGKEASFDLYEDGEQTRDFVFVDDVIQALELVSYSEKCLGKVYNVGTGVETTLNELVENISNILKTSIIINLLPEREGDIKKSSCSIEELKKLGFTPKYSIKEGLTKYIESLIFGKN